MKFEMAGVSICDRGWFGQLPAVIIVPNSALGFASYTAPILLRNVVVNRIEQEQGN